MKRYSFIYTYRYKRLAELINYLEEKYKIKYLETISFDSPLSLNFIIGVSHKEKEVIFQSNALIDKAKKCNICNFPIEAEDWIVVDKRMRDPICRNCRHIIE